MKINNRKQQFYTPKVNVNKNKDVSNASLRESRDVSKTNLARALRDGDISVIFKQPFKATDPQDRAKLVQLANCINLITIIGRNHVDEGNKYITANRPGRNHMPDEKQIKEFMVTLDITEDTVNDIINICLHTGTEEKYSFFHSKNFHTASAQTLYDNIKKLINDNHSTNRPNDVISHRDIKKFFDGHTTELAEILVLNIARLINDIKPSALSVADIQNIPCKKLTLTKIADNTQKFLKETGQFSFNQDPLQQQKQTLQSHPNKKLFGGTKKKELSLHGQKYVSWKNQALSSEEEKIAKYSQIALRSDESNLYQSNINKLRDANIIDGYKEITTKFYYNPLIHHPQLKQYGTDSYIVSYTEREKSGYYMDLLSNDIQENAVAFQVIQSDSLDKFKPSSLNEGVYLLNNNRYVQVKNISNQNNIRTKEEIVQLELRDPNRQLSTVQRKDSWGQTIIEALEDECSVVFTNYSICNKKSSHIHVDHYIAQKENLYSEGLEVDFSITQNENVPVKVSNIPHHQIDELNNLNLLRFKERSTQNEYLVQIHEVTNDTFKYKRINPVKATIDKFNSGFIIEMLSSQIDEVEIEQLLQSDQADIFILKDTPNTLYFLDKQDKLATIDLSALANKFDQHGNPILNLNNLQNKLGDGRWFQINYCKNIEKLLLQNQEYCQEKELWPKILTNIQLEEYDITYLNSTGKVVHAQPEQVEEFLSEVSIHDLKQAKSPVNVTRARFNNLFTNCSPYTSNSYHDYQWNAIVKQLPNVHEETIIKLRIIINAATTRGWHPLNHFSSICIEEILKLNIELKNHDIKLTIGVSGFKLINPLNQNLICDIPYSSSLTSYLVGREANNKYLDSNQKKIQKNFETTFFAILTKLDEHPELCNENDGATQHIITKIRQFNQTLRNVANEGSIRRQIELLGEAEDLAEEEFLSDNYRVDDIATIRMFQNVLSYYQTKFNSLKDYLLNQARHEGLGGGDEALEVHQIAHKVQNQLEIFMASKIMDDKQYTLNEIEALVKSVSTGIKDDMALVNSFNQFQKSFKDDLNATALKKISLVIHYMHAAIEPSQQNEIFGRYFSTLFNESVKTYKSGNKSCVQGMIERCTLAARTVSDQLGAIFSLCAGSLQSPQDIYTPMITNEQVTEIIAAKLNLDPTYADKSLALLNEEIFMQAWCITFLGRELDVNDQFFNVLIPLLKNLFRKLAIEKPAYMLETLKSMLSEELSAIGSSAQAKIVATVQSSLAFSLTERKQAQIEMELTTIKQQIKELARGSVKSNQDYIQKLEKLESLNADVAKMAAINVYLSTSNPNWNISGVSLTGSFSLYSYNDNQRINLHKLKTDESMQEALNIHLVKIKQEIIWLNAYLEPEKITYTAGQEKLAIAQAQLKYLEKWRILNQ